MLDSGKSGRPVEILLVEDDPGDVRLTRESLQDDKLWNKLNVVKDGVEALECLRLEGPFAGATRPNLILLDLNLPRKSGLEVLREIKTDSDLRRIPVVILTASRAGEDVRGTYDSHANCYVTKPVDLEQFITVVRSIEQFWLSIVELPTTGGAGGVQGS